MYQMVNYHVYYISALQTWFGLIVSCLFNYLINSKLSLKGLGVPFNIASYSILTHMIAHVTGLKAGDFIHTIGDCHVYLNHVSALEEQISRKPRQFPTLNIRNKVDDIENFKYTDFEVVGYDPYPVIKMEMAV
jgi:thymidylate synthase